MPRRYVFWIVTALAVAAAAIQAWLLGWTCDDAFISFRYAQHFVDGEGLVFNLDPSEAPVEGYTNFSWTMWLALGAMLGFDHEGLTTWSIFWGVVCHAGVVLLLAKMAWSASNGRAVVPIAACAYAAIHHAQSLAPAGLETALFVLLATSMLHLAMTMRCMRQAWLMGFVGVICAMTRPDGGLFVAMGGLFVLYDAVRRRAPRLLLAYVLPFVVVFVPYLLWRYSFYGYWVPNTAFAKSAGDPLLGLGWRYVSGFFLCYYALVPAFVPLVWFALKKGDLLAPIQPALGRRPWLAIAAFVLPYIFFVTWVGGDFMFGRFLLPVLPALLFGWDIACQRFRPMWLQPVIAGALVIGLCLRVEPPLLDPKKPVSDNRQISFHLVGGVPIRDLFHAAGDYMQELCDGLDVRIAITGGHANVAFRSRVPVAVECAAGLTDAYIARLQQKHRRKVGHGKPRDPLYLEKRGVHFMLEADYLEEDSWRLIYFASTPVPLPCAIVTWDRELMRELHRRDPAIQFVDFEQHLDAYIEAFPNKRKAEVAEDLKKFRRYYFDHNEDPRRLAIFEAFIK
ncbi:MAG: arabinofuranosyltransferase [Planctomycetota bacterium]|jgi:arabinofuranosyltransferase